MGRVESAESAMPNLKPQVVRVESVEYGVEASEMIKIKSSVAPKAKALVPSKYSVYKNYELVQETPDMSYIENVEDCGEFMYYVTATYETGWESEPSASVLLSN